MKLRIVCCFIALCAITELCATDLSSKKRIELRSPSNEVLLQVDTIGGELTYELLYREKHLVLPSHLIWRVDGKLLGNRVHTISLSDAKKKRSAYPLMGNHSQGNNFYRSLLIDVKEKDGEQYQIELRAYNTGISFRYKIEKKDTVTVDDCTGFHLPMKTLCWLQPNARYYEADYTCYEVGALPRDVIAGPPVTIKYSSDMYACITEGGLVNFGGMGLKVVSSDCFQSNLEGVTRLNGKITTPWRVIMVGDLNSLVNNDIVSDLAAPLSPILKKNMDWVRPGNCVWSWLAGYNVTLENMKRFTDWASELSIPYNLVDEGWSHWEDKERGLNAWDMVKELVDYSQKKGVKIWLWKAYPDRKGIEGIQTSERRRHFFAKCKEMGIAGLKIDFFDNESQAVTRYYEETLKDAAEYGLLINFHGSNKPTGLSRTYPNELSREGIKGLEFGCSVALQDVITPYTRFLAGHADYTPLAFECERMGNTTEAHQIAMTAVFLSPLRCYGGRPEDYLAHPARDIFLSIPTVWDETLVLPPSEIGDCVVMAHRKGKEWYVAALTNEEKKEIKISLSFLGRGKYHSSIVSDRETEADRRCRLSYGNYMKNDELNIRMVAGGGYLAHLVPVK